MCSGKIYFELDERRKKQNLTNVAIIRLEQLYPLPQKNLDELYAKYNKAIWYWVQEEPLNMGAASFLRMNLKNINFYILSRQASAATASGYGKIHAKEQAEIIDTAFSI
jgi:2-oxoglutarate dehydrogenase E1 component